MDQHAAPIGEARLRDVRMGEMRARLERRDGAIYVHSLETLGEYARTMTDRLEHWAKATPDALFLADRGDDGAWRKVMYAEAWGQVQRLAAALLPYGLSADHP